MKKTTLAIAIAATLTLSTTAFAQNAQGFYAGGNLGYSSMDLYGSWSDTTGLGYNFHGGYNFTPNWAGEAGYTHYADATQTGNSVKYQAYSIDMAAKGSYFFNYQWSAFGKLGLADLHTDVSGNGATSESKTKIHPLFGFGAGYRAAPHLMFNAGWSYVMGGDGENDQGNMSMLYAGVDYRF